MNKFNNFLNKNGTLVTIILLVLLLFRTCSNDSKRLIELSERVDSLATKKDVQIEGLKSEKRMIQSTDRKMMDVNRQTAIDQEIEKLSK
jgi:hypothetical protein